MKKRWLNLVAAVLYAVTGVLWIHNAVRDASGFALIVALVWLVGAGIWIARFYKERKESQKEK